MPGSIKSRNDTTEIAGMSHFSILILPNDTTMVVSFKKWYYSGSIIFENDTTRVVSFWECIFNCVHKIIVIITIITKWYYSGSIILQNDTTRVVSFCECEMPSHIYRKWVCVENN